MMLTLGLASLIVVVCTASVVPEPKETKLAHATNDLAFDLLRSYSKEKNVFISPFSISTALGLVYLGSDGTTEKAMRGVLKYDQYGLDYPDVHDGFQSFLSKVKHNSDDYQLSTVNRVLVQQNFIILHMYGHALKQYYQAQIESVDFANQGEQIKTKINDIVDSATNGKIKNFLADSPSADTKLFLLNAVYFLGNWKHQFSEYGTFPRSFYNNGVEEKQVETMHRTGRYQYSVQNSLDASVVVLPYKGNNSANMIIVLPHEKTGVAEVEKKISQELLDEVLATSRSDLIRLSLPKFKLEYSVNLVDSLSALGLGELFGDDADLSRISGDRTLKVSSILHKAVIEVNEKGSEAAAATGIEVTTKSGVFPSHTVNVDHPFLFLIREDKTGMILFSGRVDEL